MNTTRLPWEIPTTWEWVRIGDVAAVVGGGTPRTNVSGNFQGGDVPWLTPADLSGYTEKYIERGERNITEEGLRNSAARLLPTGTVLFSSRAPIGYVAIARNSLATNQGFKSFVLPSAVDGEYVYYYLQRGRELALGLASGTTFQEVSGRQAAKIPLPIAPFPEQRRIVEAIESYFPRLDDAVATLGRAQRNLERYRASVLKAAVEGRLVPTEAELARAEGRDFEAASVLLERVLTERRHRWEEAELSKMLSKGKTPEGDKWKTKYKEPIAAGTTERPSLPEGWGWTTVDELSWDGGYGTSRKCQVDATGPPVLRIPNVQNETLNFDNLKFATGEEDLPSEGVLVPGDFIFIRTNGSKSLIGRGALVDTPLPQEYYFASYLIRLRLAASSTTARWFALAWHAPVVRDQILRDAASSAGQHNVSLSAARSYLVPLPPLAEQERILAEVERLLSVSGSANSIVRSSIARAASLRQSILKWAFEGRLVDQDPTDEPASRLLERLKSERESTDGDASRSVGCPRARSPKA